MLQWLLKLFRRDENLGDKGERLAAKFLKKKGFRILARQYRNKIGEIDLIARNGETIIFIEVKTRQSDKAGLPVEAVTPTKQKQIIRTALAYLKRYRLLEHRIQFDIIGILWGDESSPPVIEHYENAFSSEEFGQMFS